MVHTRVQPKQMTPLEQARNEARHWRDQLLNLHRDACVCMGKYCESMERVQTLTTAFVQPLLGGNPEAENELRKLLIVEPPFRTLMTSGNYEAWMGWGWDKQCPIVPVKAKYPHNRELVEL